MKRAPLATFLRSFSSCGMTSFSLRLWFVVTAPRKKCVRSISVSVRPWMTVPSFMSLYMRRRPTESMSKTGAATPDQPRIGASPDRARMLWKPSEDSFHARLWIALRFQSLQARWMITSCPREMRSVPIVSADSIASPAGLSVIERTSMRGSATSSRAISRARRARVSVISPRLVTSSAAVMKRSVSDEEVTKRRPPVVAMRLPGQGRRPRSWSRSRARCGACRGGAR